MASAIARAPGGPSSYRTTVAALAGAIALAWILCLAAELSGTAAQFHHHALYESGRPFWLSALIILSAWQVMTAAMMLPSSLGFIRMYAAAARNAPDFSRALALFLAAYFAVWTGFALIAFGGDMQLHRWVDAWPWLEKHSNLIAVLTLAVAAAYQLTPLKDACPRACRHPGVYLTRHYRRGALNGLRIGFGHATFCLGCCWALMLVMFAAGVAHLAWMGALALIMLVEKGVPHGERIVVPVGATLGLLAAIALFAPHAVPGL
jgi:predicted metal-binding membrane protein